MNGDLREQASSQLFTLKGELVLPPFIDQSAPQENEGGTVTIASRLLASGEIIDRKYKVIKLLGQGGMGAVYKAHHLMLNKDVALKTFRSPNLTDEDLKRFQREAQAIAKLNHQNVVHVFDFGIDEDNIPYYTMECLEGESLAERLEEEKYLVLEEAVAIFLQVCQGMALAHSKGIIHRDLKPANIFLARGLATGKKAEAVKIVDFGIAGLAVQSLDSQKLTSTGMIFGSPLYMSPEQSLGLEVTARSDIYSCGCALFETLTGSPPFKGVNAFATMLKHQTEPTPTMESLPEEHEFPKRLVGLTARMMAKSDAKRPQSFDEVASELEEILQAYKLHYAGQNRRNRASRDSDNFAGLIARSNDVLSVILKNRKAIIAAAVVIALFFAIYALAVLNPQNNKLIVKARKSEIEDLEQGVSKMPPYLQNPGETKTEGRKFLFPREGNLGYLRWVIRKQDDKEVHKIKTVGLISVPPGKFLTLEADEHATFNPNSFSGFGPNDLDELILDETNPWDYKHMKYVGNLTGLQKLFIAHTNIGDSSLADLDKLKHLVVLDVSLTQFTGPALAKLEVLPRLVEFSANNLQKASALLPKFKNSQRLKSLLLNNCDLDDEDMQVIGTISNLEKLKIGKSKKVTDKGLEAVSHLNHLKSLRIDGTGISAKAISLLKKLPLTELTIDLNKWSKKDKEALFAELPDCNIEQHDPKQDIENYQLPKMNHQQKNDLMDLYNHEE